MGGFSTSQAGALTSSELYDPATGNWTGLVRTCYGHDNHSATLLPNGRVLVAGGGGRLGGISGVELYHPEINTWRALGSMLYAHWLHTATLLVDGRVLVAGGVRGTNSVYPTSELYVLHQVRIPLVLRP